MSSVDGSNVVLVQLLAPFPRNRLPRRLTQLMVGLVLYGFTMGLMIRATLGLDPWDVFHQGLTFLFGGAVSIGLVITVMSVLVLLLWIPLKQRPGLGTLANAATIGVVTDLTLSVLPAPEDMVVRIAFLVVAIVGNALAGALYIGAGLGPGPRDGLMTGIVARGFGTIRLVRTGIELTVLVIGWLLGGLIGVGTVLYALSIGPLLHLMLPKLQIGSPAVDPASQAAVEADSAEAR